MLRQRYHPAWFNDKSFLAPLTQKAAPSSMLRQRYHPAWFNDEIVGISVLYIYYPQPKCYG